MPIAHGQITTVEVLDFVPVRVWILIAMAVTAVAPAAYIYRFVVHAPSRREITKPPQNLEWRSTRAMAGNVAILLAVASMGIFIFTPAAARFARSPAFLPLLFAAFGGLALFGVTKGLLTGRITPLVRGFNNTYDRQSHPKRYWASMGWNVTLGCFVLWAAVATIDRQPADRCHDRGSALPDREQLAACTDALGKQPRTKGETADLYATRGFVRHELREYDEAIADYDKAIEYNPEDSYSLYNRALIYLQGEQFQFAIEDFTRSLELRGDNVEGFINRGEAYLATGRSREGLADFTRAYAIDPDNMRALANRGIAFALAGDRSRAEQDFRTVRAKDPSNPIASRGQILLSLKAGDFNNAIRDLTNVLNRQPNDEWSLGVLAEAYRRIGQEAKSREISQRRAAIRQARRGNRRITTVP